MKKNRFLLEFTILIGTVIPFIIVYLLKGKAPFIEFDRYLKGTLIFIIAAYFYPLYVYQKNINRLSNSKANYRYRVAWFIISLSFSGLYLFEETLSLSPDNYFKYFFILTGIFYMIDGNYQILVPKMGFNSFNDDEIVYRKMQRNSGRIEFFIGLVLVISCLIVPKSRVNIFDVYVTLNFIFLIGVAWVKITTK